MRIGTAPALTPYQAPGAAAPAPAPQQPQDSLAAPAFSDDILKQWAKFRANDENRPAQLLDKQPDVTLHLGDVRWGFHENGTDTSKWQPIYKDAKIDPKDVKDVFIAVEPFPPIALGGGHGEAVIEFNKPFTNSDGEQDNRLVVSLEAWKEKGQTWTPLKGLKKNFGVVHQLCTFTDRVQKQARKEGRDLILYRLNLTPEQREGFVRNSLNDALKDRTGEYYNTIEDSCFQNQVVQLDDVLPPEHQIHRWTKLFHLPRLEAVLPGLAGLVLERKGLRTPDQPIKISPDAQMYPSRAAHSPSLAARITQNPWFANGCRLAGVALGAGVALHFGGIPAAVLGGLLGNSVAGVASDHARILNGAVQEEPQQFYSDQLKAQLNISGPLPKSID